jgi:hypothetical protein
MFHETNNKLKFLHMNLKDILAISGYSGLFRFISQGRSGVIVEGLIDKKRMNATASARVSALDDIAIYTDDKEIPLKEVLKRIYKKEDGKPTIDPKSPVDKLKAYFEEVIPEYDHDKVYVSDMKKVFTWYNILLDLKMVDLEEDPKEETEKEEETEKKTETESETKSETKSETEKETKSETKNVKHKNTKK